MIYELGGPEVKTFRECLELVLAEIDRKRLLVPVPFAACHASRRRCCKCLPKPLLTVDQVRQLKVDNVVSEAATGRRPHDRRLSASIRPASRRCCRLTSPATGPPASSSGATPEPAVVVGGRRRRGEIDGKADDADDDPPPAEQGEAVAADEAEEGSHHDQRRQEGDDEADGDDQRVARR